MQHFSVCAAGSVMAPCGQFLPSAGCGEGWAAARDLAWGSCGTFGTCQWDNHVLFVGRVVPFLVGCGDCPLPQPREPSVCVQEATSDSLRLPMNLWSAMVGDLVDLICWISMSPQCRGG